MAAVSRQRKKRNFANPERQCKIRQVSPEAFHRLAVHYEEYGLSETARIAMVPRNTLYTWMRDKIQDSEGRWVHPSHCSETVCKIGRPSPLEGLDAYVHELIEDRGVKVSHIPGILLKEKGIKTSARSIRRLMKNSFFLNKLK